MKKTRFEWDEKKDAENQKKHGVQFSLAQYAFADPSRVIAEDLAHSETEKRYFVSARSRVVFSLSDTYRGGVIRIFGAGYWRKGKAIYECENQIHQ
jgi:hypothetical protein